MKKRKKGKYDALVGALGGGGGGFLGLAIRYALDKSGRLSSNPELEAIYINLGFSIIYMIIGLIMIIMATAFYLKGLIEDLAGKVGKQESENYSSPEERNST